MTLAADRLYRPGHNPDDSAALSLQSNDDVSKVWLFYQDESLRLYEIHRLDIAVHHVLGPTVDIETTTVLEGAMFVHWAAKVSTEQVARVIDIDGVCYFPYPSRQRF